MSLTSAGRTQAGSNLSSRRPGPQPDRGDGISVTNACGPRKRVLDFAMAFVLLALIAVPMLLIAVAIRLTSPGPAIFRQIRLGRDEQPFVLFKFRTMRQGCPEDIHREFVTRHMAGGDAAESGGLHKLSADPRITPIGRILRRTSLDELPQLLNVLLGTMSMVGPRPSLPWEAELFPPDARARFRVRPGITGLWQVSGRSRLTMRQALALDVAYVERWRLRTDLGILLRTVPVLFRYGDAR